MDYGKLKTHQTALLDLYTSLRESLNTEGDEIDPGLKAMQVNIAAEKFLLAIIGEVKAGKSTFINAILEKAILPADDLQATSEIVEIYRSDKMGVQVTFANGKTQVVEDDPKTPENEVVSFLKQVACVKKEYRGMPMVQVDKFLIDHYIEEEGKAIFEQEELKSFISDPDLENIYKLDQEDFGRKIREYIEKNISCDKIPKRVTLGYPHDFSEFDHFRIVDTPGINAIGGIEDRTKEFIIQADAVIYLHNASQLESRALRNALENELPEKVKDRLILVLTHRQAKFRPRIDEHENILEEASENILEEARKIHPEIGPDKIFFVDSLTELYLKAFSLSGKSMDEINDSRKRYRELQRLIADPYELACGNENTLIALLETQSNFKEIREKIERDSIDSASLQMKDFARDLRKAYGDLRNKIKLRMKPLESEYRDPQFFASNIQNQRGKMEKVERDYKEFESKLRDISSCYSQKLNPIMSTLFFKIGEKIFKSNDHDYQKEKQVRDFIKGELHKNFVTEMNDLVGKLNEKSKRATEVANRNVGVRIDAKIAMPAIPLGNILDTASIAAGSKIKKQLAEVDEERNFRDRLKHLIFRSDTKATENKRVKIRRSFPIHYWIEMKPELKKLYTSYKTDLSRQIDEKVNAACEKYKTVRDKELQKEEKGLKIIKGKEKENKELGDEISCLEKEETRIDTNIQKCEKLRAQL